MSQVRYIDILLDKMKHDESAECPACGCEIDAWDLLSDTDCDTGRTTTVQVCPQCRAEFKLTICVQITFEVGTLVGVN